MRTSPSTSLHKQYKSDQIIGYKCDNSTSYSVFKANFNTDDGSIAFTTNSVNNVLKLSDENNSENIHFIEQFVVSSFYYTEFFKKQI